nr:hypothetical protein [uncultured Blautia sp.]
MFFRFVMFLNLIFRLMQASILNTAKPAIEMVAKNSNTTGTV